MFSLALSGGKSVELTTGVTLTASDLPGLHSMPPGGAVAQVASHPTDPSVQGLRNLSQRSWRVQLPNGDSVEVKPGKNVRLAAGTRINFGSVQGEITAAAKKVKRSLWIPIAAGACVLLAIGLYTFRGSLATKLPTSSGPRQEQASTTARSWSQILTRRSNVKAQGALLKIGSGYRIEKGQYAGTVTAQRWGFIDSTGRTIIEPAWDQANDFREGLACVAHGGKYGYIDTSGKLVLDLKWDAASPFVDGIASVKQGGKWGVIDKSGHFVIQPQWEEAVVSEKNATAGGNGSSSGVAIVKRDGKYGLIDNSGRVIVEPQWEEKPYFSEGVAFIKRGGKYGLIDKAGSSLAEPQWDEKSYFSDGVAQIKKAGKYGFIDKTGRALGEPKWDSAYSFSDGLAQVRENEKYGFVDKTGRAVIPPQWEYADQFYEGLAKVGVRVGSPENSKTVYGFIDKTGRFAIEAKWDEAGDFHEGLASVGRRKKDTYGSDYGYIDKSGRVVAEPQWESAGGFSGGLAEVRKGGNYGLIDRTGRLLVQPQWQSISISSKGDVITVQQHGKYGTIDRNGRIIVQPEWQNSPYFYDDVAQVQRNKRFGLVDKTGKLVLEPVWDVVSSFQEAKDAPLYRMLARRDGEKTVVVWTDASGKQIWSSGEEIVSRGPPRTLNVPSNYATIQKAVDAAKPGDTILVSPGVYNEAVEVNMDKLTLRGTDREKCIIRLGVKDSKQAAGCLSIKNCRSVAVSDFTFDRSIAPTGSHAVVLDADDVKMSSCIVRSGGEGIGFGYNGESATFSDLLIENCGGNGLKVEGGAYSVGPEGGAKIAVTHCTFRDNKGDGLVVSTSQLEASENTSIHNGGNGISVSKSIAKLSKNTCKENKQAGIRLANTSGEAVDNSSDGNGTDGISADREASTVIARNHCFENGAFGIKNERPDGQVQVSADNALQSNRAGQICTARVAPEFCGVWTTDGLISGFGRTGEKLYSEEIKIGNWHDRLVITPDGHGNFTEEITYQLRPGSGYWQRVPPPYNTTRQIYLKYAGEADRFTLIDSLLEISWKSRWEETPVEIRPKDMPIKGYFDRRENYDPSKVKLNGPNELQIDDCTEYGEGQHRCTFRREH